MTEREAFEESSISRYFAAVKTKCLGRLTLYEKLLLLVAMWSTRYYDIVLIEPESRSPKVQKMYDAFVAAETSIERMSHRKISTFIYHNTIYLLTRFFGKE